MEEQGKFVGSDTFTSNTPGLWFDENSVFVQYYGSGEVRKFTNVKQITGEALTKLLNLNGWTADETKFYYSSAVYSYTREEWDACHDSKTEDNMEAIDGILF